MPADYLKLIKDSPDTGQIRAFIAVELPEEVKAHLGKLQDILKAAGGSCAKWVNPEGIHLTLKFLGNVDIDRLGSIIKVMEETARHASAFQIELTGLGAFPSLRRVQTVWAGIDGKLDQLQALQNDLDAGLEKIGFPREKRQFVPHLTLARVRDHISDRERLALGETIGQTRAENRFVIPVGSLSLIRSQLSREGAIYTTLYSVELKF